MSTKNSDTQTETQQAEYEGPMGADERYGRNQQYGQGDNDLLDRHSGDDTETDPALTDESGARSRVRRALDQSGLDVADVEVSVADDRVTLDGETMDDINRNEIEKLAAAQAGVMQVRNLLRVRRGVAPDLGTNAESEDANRESH